MKKKILKLLDLMLSAIVASSHLMFCAFSLGFWRKAVGGFLPFVGRFTGVNSMMKRHIAATFPQMSPQEVNAIAQESWRNMGYVMLEYCHITDYKDGIHNPHIEVEGLEYVQALVDDGKPGVIFTAHYGSWQLISMVARSIGLNMGQVFRPANNTAANWAMERTQKNAVDHIFPRGRRGTKALVEYLESGGHLMMMVDQNYYEGMILPFLGRPAFTAPGLVKMKRKYDCPVIPARVIRKTSSTFKVIFYPPLELEDTGDALRDDTAFMGRVNDIISGWILDNPAQWMWQHNRWKVERILKIRELQRQQEDRREPEASK